MKKVPAILHIVDAEYLDRFSLKLRFSDGKIQTIDFEPFLRKSAHPEVKKYLDLKKFRRFHCQDGELMWGDFDLIFPAADLYLNSI